MNFIVFGFYLIFTFLYGYILYLCCMPLSILPSIDISCAYICTSIIYSIVYYFVYSSYILFPLSYLHFHLLCRKESLVYDKRTSVLLLYIHTLCAPASALPFTGISRSGSGIANITRGLLMRVHLYFLYFSFFFILLYIYRG